MNLSGFSFLITGVLLNAGAQLLLKAGTNVLGVITLTRDNWAGHAGAGWRREPHFVAGVVCYGCQPDRLDPRAVARAGVDRLSDAVAGLRHQRDRRALPVRRSASRVTRWLGIGFIVVGVWLVARSVTHRA